MHQRQTMPVPAPPHIPSNMGILFDRHLLDTKRGKVHGGEYWAPNVHHLAAYHDGPSKPHLYGNPKAYELGIVPLIAAAASAYGAYQSGQNGAGAPPGGGPAQGGPTTGMQQPGSASATTVSPTFQTEISPQISPVFSQMQDSAGATQAATTTQYKPGGMSAEGGSATAQPALPGLPPLPAYSPPSPSYFSGPTKSGGLPMTPLDPRGLTSIRDMPTAGTLIRDIEQAKGFNWTPVYVIGGVAVVGTLAYMFLKKKR